MVEIALLLPILLILFLGIAEVGFFLFAHVQIANAAREGARYGTLCKLNEYCDGGDGNYSNSTDLTTVVEQVVANEAQNLVEIGVNTTVTVEPSLTAAPAAGTPITVTVTYNHTPPFISGFVPMFPSTIPIEHQVIMRFQ